MKCIRSNKLENFKNVSFNALIAESNRNNYTEVRAKKHSTWKGVQTLFIHFVDDLKIDI